MADAQPEDAAIVNVKNDPGAAADYDNLHAIPSYSTDSTSNSGLKKPKPDPEGEDNASNYLEQLVSKTSIEDLENGVKIGVQLLETLKAPLNSALEDAEVTQAAQWLKAIEHLQAEAKPTRSIVGVVGNTGAGKSSIINALLDEERLVPTNGMRACTASATEISYNYDDNHERLYRAQIEFVSTADWAAELDILFNDLLDGSGNVSRECTNPDTDAGVAYSKIKAVYPRKTKDEIANSNPARMAQEPAVRGVLGTVKELNATNAARLYKGLQHYVDSKEKTPGQEAMMEYWPLIKVVRIYCKAPALSTGAVIVDLPGVHDSNAARAAVAQSYMKSCTGLWITAAIQRAVDDKTAKKLLGDSFKRQLKFDGLYSAVTFICTKTDDILESEVADSLNIGGQVGEKWARTETLRLEQRQFKRLISELKDQKYDVDNQLDSLDNKEDIWDELSTQLLDGKTVYRPSDNDKKRKRNSQKSGPRKRRSSVDSDSDYDDDFSAGDDADSQQGVLDENRIALTEDEIQAELASIKSRKKELRQSRKDIDRKVSEIKKQMAECAVEEAGLTSEIKSTCIKGRSEYSRSAIRTDFAMGIKELDQEAALEEDEEAFDPDQDARNYDDVAKTLPVFCVSARAYQKLSGRLQKDAVHIDGFPSLADTEIPQLQEHTKQLTKASRVANCRHFLNELNHLLNSLKLWACDDSRMFVSKKDQRNDEMFVRAQLESLRTHLSDAAEDCISNFHMTLGEQLYETFDRLIPTAAAQAVPTATAWGAHRSLGGLFWATYKATVRRSGVFHGASGERDFNAELFEPVSKHLANPWERTFQTLLPSALNRLVRDFKRKLDEFHNDAVSGVQNPTANPAGLNMLKQNLRGYHILLDATPATWRATVSELQKDANRGFTPIIQQTMQPAYILCTNESGAGSYSRMKGHMIDHVQASRQTMFRQACNAVQAELDEVHKVLKDLLQWFVDSLLAQIEQEYLTVLVGKDAQAQGVLSRAERKLRSEMSGLLAEADLWFAALCSQEDEDMPFNASTVTQDDENVADADEAMAQEDGVVDPGDVDSMTSELISQQLEGSQQYPSETLVFVKSEPI